MGVRVWLSRVRWCVVSLISEVSRFSAPHSDLKSADEMFDCLLEHGCDDFTSRMDPNQYSSMATAGGSFGDVWKGMLLNGRQVAIKCLRFHSIAEDRPKGLKVSKACHV